MLYVIAYYLLYPLFKLLFKLQIKGKDKLPAEGPAIIAANHSSYLDPILLGLAFYPRKLKFMAKAELFRIPLFNLLISRLGAFPVKRERVHRGALQTATELLQKKGFFSIFPEGTRHKKQLGQGQLGAALIALKTKAPIIPVAIKDSNLVWPEGSWRFYFPQIKVIIGAPIEVIDDNSHWRKQAEKLTANLMQEIKTLLKDEGEHEHRD